LFALSFRVAGWKRAGEVVEADMLAVEIGGMGLPRLLQEEIMAIF
jgi:hypothetical protein